MRNNKMNSNRTAAAVAISGAMLVMALSTPAFAGTSASNGAVAKSVSGASIPKVDGRKAKKGKGNFGPGWGHLLEILDGWKDVVHEVFTPDSSSSTTTVGMTDDPLPF